MGDDRINADDERIDLSGLSLRDLDEIGESSLAQAIRTLLDSADDEPIAGFSQRI